MENKFKKPVVVYDNTERDKASILKDNTNKSGVYRWINKVNNKTYIGSAIELRTRFYVFYSAKRLINSNMAIYKAILKYGYSNFKLEILEYCNKDEVLVKEQCYIDLFKPEYNILTKAGSSFGYKHSQKTLKKFKIRTVSVETRFNLSKSAKGRVLSEETKAKISVARKGIKLSDITRAKLSRISTMTRGLAVLVYNIQTGEEREYLTVTKAALALNVSRTTIKNNIKSGKILKDKYIIKLKKKT
jgi:group I intron endonuclease